MSQAELRELFARPATPWVVVAADGAVVEEELREELAVSSGIAWVPMDGAAMAQFESLMVAFQAAFKIPDYFGHNWPALDETLTDLEWFPAEGYVVHIRDAHRVLRNDDPSELRIFTKTLGQVAQEWSVPVEVGEYWDRGPVPFHWLLTCPEEEHQGILDLFSETETHAPRVVGA